MNREYVIVSPKHSNYPFPGALVFWGEITADDEERSFGGYTFNLDKCERYTLKEITDEYSELHLYCGGGYEELFQHGNVIIKASELLKINTFKKATIIYRP